MVVFMRFSNEGCLVADLGNDTHYNNDVYFHSQDANWYQHYRKHIYIIRHYPNYYVIDHNSRRKDCPSHPFLPLR